MIFQFAMLKNQMVYIYMRANYNISQTWNKASWDNSPNHYSRVESGPEVVIVYPYIYIYTLHIHIHPRVDRIWKFQEILTKTGKCQKDGVSMCIYIWLWVKTLVLQVPKNIWLLYGYSPKYGKFIGNLTHSHILSHQYISISINMYIAKSIYIYHYL